MGVGILEFSEGLIFALREKSKRLKRNIAEHMRTEADEVFILKNFLESQIAAMVPESEARSAAEAFLGIVYIAQHMMQVPRMVADSESKLAGDIRNRAEQLTDMLIAFEESFELADGASAIQRTGEAFHTVFTDPDRVGYQIGSDRMVGLLGPPSARRNGVGSDKGKPRQSEA